jgi:hypothetical protein
LRTTASKMMASEPTRNCSFRPVSFDPACSSSLPDPPDYEFSPATIDEGFHVEFWCEKTTLADVLLPLAGQYRLNVVMGAGDLSLTHCHQFLQRARESGRAVRVLYVSDFDPSGRGMPVSVASKIAFLNQGLGLDIQVRPVALTHDQCVEHRLPRTPIKETAHGKDKFEERFGTGATELDALEALHPGLLRQILVQEIERYQDDELDDLVEEAANEFQERLDDARQNVLDRHEAEIEALRSRHRDISRDYRAEAEEVVDRCNAELAEIVGRCNAELAPIVEKYQPEIAEITEKYNVFQRNHRCRTGRRGARRRRNRVAGAGRGRRGSRPVIRLDPGLRHPD